jgi:hypothetical protein
MGVVGMHTEKGEKCSYFAKILGAGEEDSKEGGAL